MENLITQMLVKKSLFVTNKEYLFSFPWNYCVTTFRFAYLHTVTVGQATVSTEMEFRFLANVISHDFINIIYTRQTRDKPRNRRIFK